jgi:hypothetical protein
MAKPKIANKTYPFSGIELNEPVHDLLGYTVFIYGPPKVGKTTAAVSWPNPIVFACEVKGISALKVNHIKIRSWDNFTKAVKTMKRKANKNKFKTVIIDTVDLMYKYCLDFCCDKYGFEHPSDQGWAKGWEAVADEFMAAVLDLFDTGYTLIFLSHTKETEVEEDWEKFTRTNPTLSGTGRRVLLPLVDVILYMTARTTKKGGSIRTVTTKGARAYEAGDRTKGLTDVTIRIPSKMKDKAYDLICAVYKENTANL